MREVLIALMLGLPGLALINSIVLGAGLKGFLSRTPSLGSRSDLDAFKKKVAAQMYAALVQIPLVLAPSICFIVGMWQGVFGWMDLLYAIVPALVLSGVGKAYKRVEDQARTMEVPPELKEEYQAVCRTWVEKAFPDF